MRWDWDREGCQVQELEASFIALSTSHMALDHASTSVPGRPNWRMESPRRALAAKAPSDARHSFLLWLLPEKAFRAIERGTRQWAQVCSTCGHVQDFWDAGGVRYKACGEPGKLMFCENCQKLHMHKIRMKTHNKRLDGIA